MFITIETETSVEYPVRDFGSTARRQNTQRPFGRSILSEMGISPTRTFSHRGVQ
jgi:hypothetical protein